MIFKEVPPPPSTVSFDGGEVIEGLIECVFAMGVLMEARRLATYEDLITTRTFTREKQLAGGATPREPSPPSG
jgi:hypothetical protein